MNTTLNRTERTEFLITNSDAAVPVRLSSRTIVDIARVSGTRKVQVEFDAIHGLNVGDRLYISGCDEAEFNTASLTDNHGLTGALIRNVYSTTIVELMLDGSTNGATLTAPVCYADIWVRQATLIGKKAYRTVNVGTVYIGTRSANDNQPYAIASDGEAFLPAGREANGPLVNLADWYLDVDNANDGLYVLYF
jgi:hypothetical protein